MNHLKYFALLLLSGWVAEADHGRREDIFRQLQQRRYRKILFCGSGALPDEIGVFKFKSSDAAKSAEAALQSKLESRKESFETYTPDEMYKLETAKIFSTGNYAVYIALADNEKAKEIVDGKLKG